MFRKYAFLGSTLEILTIFSKDNLALGPDILTTATPHFPWPIVK